MKLLIVQKGTQSLEAILHKAKEKLQLLYKNVEFIIWNDPKMQITKADIAKIEPDLLLTWNLAGFEQSTLTGGLAYNLLDCKQIHLLTRENLRDENCLSRQLSIAMFFYCAGAEYFRRLQAEYPDIPYLKQLNGWSLENTPAAVNGNADILYNVILEVAGICHIES